MSPGKYFFDTKHDARDLPSEKAGRRNPRVAATASFLYREEDFDRRAEELLASLCSPHALSLDRTKGRPLSSVFSLLKEFAARYPTVTALPPPTVTASVSLSLHALYFTAGTAIHHTARADLPVTLSARHTEGEGAAILISAERASESEEEAAAILGLDGGRLSLLTALGGLGGFSLSVSAGERSSLAITLSPSKVRGAQVTATTDPSLLAAFLLPLSYFSI